LVPLREPNSPMLLDYVPCLFLSWGMTLILRNRARKPASSGGEGPTNALAPKAQACECEATGDNAKGDGEVAALGYLVGIVLAKRIQ
jgi:hypothetical protein